MTGYGPSLGISQTSIKTVLGRHMQDAGSVALVTGASRGIGAATARELGKRGHHVIVNYRSDADAARSVVDDIESQGASATSFAADVTDSEQVNAMMDDIGTDHGRLDVLVCNANTARPPFDPLSSLAWDTFIAKINGELAGVFFVTQRAMEIMRAQRSGRIVYVSSVSADYVGPGRLSHSTAKSAINQFSRHVAAEAAEHGIAVNTVAPDFVRTDATRLALTEERTASLTENSLLDRVLEPADIAATIGFLADDSARAITGAVIRADGGFGVLAGGPFA